MYHYVAWCLGVKVSLYLNPESREVLIKGAELEANTGQCILIIGAQSSCVVAFGFKGIPQYRV